MSILIAITISSMSYWYLIYRYQGEINNYIDVYAPQWVTFCRFCRGYHFGTIQGILYMLIIFYDKIFG